jgi:hypothetical protein
MGRAARWRPCRPGRSVRAYLALFRAGFLRQTPHRLALAAGLATNAFFGVVRTAVFDALYRERDQVAGLDMADALTYVWILEGLFAVIWAPWFWELAEAIRSGGYVVELLRPGDPYRPAHPALVGPAPGGVVPGGRPRGRRPDPGGARHRGHCPPHRPGEAPPPG